MARQAQKVQDIEHKDAEVEHTEYRVINKAFTELKLLEPKRTLRSLSACGL